MTQLIVTKPALVRSEQTWATIIVVVQEAIAGGYIESAIKESIRVAQELVKLATVNEQVSEYEEQSTCSAITEAGGLRASS